VDNNCDASTDEPGAAGCGTWYYDGDGDGYGAASACLCEPSDGYSAEVGGDCYDGNAAANPGASGWSTVDRGDGSYDFDCDGAATQRYTAVYSCYTPWYNGWGCESSGDGYDGAAPSCGATGTWQSGCEAEWWACYPTAEASLTESCR
jgi:hypothetical protein